MDVCQVQFKDWVSYEAYLIIFYLQIGPAKSLKTIATFVSERDDTVRRAGLIRYTIAYPRTYFFTIKP